ncbi:MAG: hypothetical protein NTZ35_02200 [Ignavibacteriales bacterium]|nr:hypothetical protein [Ignavibacteriales bacterium]
MSRRQTTYLGSFAVVLLATCYLMPLDVSAQNSYALGGLAGSAMRMGFGARGMTMGNSIGAMTNEDGLSYYNPAIVPFQTERTAYVSTGFLPLDRSLNFLSYTQSLKPAGGFSLAILNAGVTKIEGRNSDGLQTETYSTSENEFLFSFGTKIRPDFAIGVSAKILYYSLFEGVKSTTVGFDLGILYKLNEEWALGLIVGDINSKYKWDTSTLYGQDGNTTIEHFPLRRRLAICYTPTYFRSRFSGEIEWIGSTWLSRAGAEIPLHDNLTLRGGIDQVAYDGSINAKPSLGFSLQGPVAAWKPILTYGYIFEPYSAGGIHMLSLTVGFE